MQTYHANAKTNFHVRTKIQSSQESFLKLSQRYGVSVQTVHKWKKRTFQNDVSSRPKNLSYSLTQLQENLIISVRRSSWFSLDEITEMFSAENVTRSTVYRCLKRNNLSTKPKEQREKLKKFKEYEPGFIHLDVTYLPKIQGVKYYLFVAIDRATRTMYYQVYDNKSADSTDDFFDKCMSFFPFKITHILTDNGLEFTNKLLKSKKGQACAKKSKLDIKCEANEIEHRLTLPRKPQTNGMVERLNGIIKSNTVAKIDFTDVEHMKCELTKFFVYYNLQRRHGSLRKEFGVKTPFDAVKKWYELKPEIFIQKPLEFQKTILFLPCHSFSCIKQRCET
ncbi:MAG: IS481 family transposase [Capnocytophaga sp.]|nr:IS481 family transposase [Capnocytophaga sp.]